MRNELLGLSAILACAWIVILFVISGGSLWLQTGAARVAEEAQSAAVFFVTSITAAQIQDDYRGVTVAQTLPDSPEAAAATKKVRILIVPGHQPNTGGTEFGGVRERDLVVDIADVLAELLSQNRHYEVTVARTDTAWNPVLQSYFDANAAAIETFVQSQKTQMEGYLANGSILPAADQVYHLTAPSQAVLQLYGINKWASDNHYDITLHLHLNDDPEHRWNVAGRFSGFAVYVPDHQYSNAEASRAIGETIAARLGAYHATSTLPKEDKGVVEDQQLIAIGSNNTADDAALLIEYGYIYEPQFQLSSVRSLAIADYAFQTYLGLQDFFKDPILPTYGSVAFPYDWTKVTGKKNEKGPQIYALQEALHHLGYYPPRGKTFSDCPVSGVAGACTRAALAEYQDAHGIVQTGTIESETRAALDADLVRP